MHRKFGNEIAPLLTREVIGHDGQARSEVFNHTTIVPYSYRHCFAQRHADAGVQPDVLRELMSHRSLRTTQRYYEVSKVRIRDAVDRVNQRQLDGAGRRVGREVGLLLSEEGARADAGQVAVPFGACTEPSNVRTGGQACPYHFPCLNCGHFRSDPAYVKELKSYRQRRVIDRERLHAVTDLEDWVRTALHASDAEIATLRNLIRRLEATTDTTAATEDRASTHGAVEVSRGLHEPVELGIPSARASAPDNVAILARTCPTR